MCLSVFFCGSDSTYQGGEVVSGPVYVVVKLPISLIDSNEPRGEQTNKQTKKTPLSRGRVHPLSLYHHLLAVPTPFFSSGKQTDFYHSLRHILEYRKESSRQELGGNAGAEREIYREKEGELENEPHGSWCS